MALTKSHPPNIQILCQLNNNGSLAPDKFDLSPLDLSISNDPFDQLDELTPALACNHPTLGFMIAKCHHRYCAYVSNDVQYTSEGRIKNARRKYVGSLIVLVNNTPGSTATSAIMAFQMLPSCPTPQLSRSILLRTSIFP
jgi:hypothetical protein